MVVACLENLQLRQRIQVFQLADLVVDKVDFAQVDERVEILYLAEAIERQVERLERGQLVQVLDRLDLIVVEVELFDVGQARLFAQVLTLERLEQVRAEANRAQVGELGEALQLAEAGQAQIDRINVCLEVVQVDLLRVRIVDYLLFELLTLLLKCVVFISSVDSRHVIICLRIHLFAATRKQHIFM